MSLVIQGILVVLVSKELEAEMDPRELLGRKVIQDLRDSKVKLGHVVLRVSQEYSGLQVYRALRDCLVNRAHADLRVILVLPEMRVP